MKKAVVKKVEAKGPQQGDTFLWICPICGERNGCSIMLGFTGKNENCSNCGTPCHIEIEWEEREFAPKKEDEEPSKLTRKILFDINMSIHDEKLFQKIWNTMQAAGEKFLKEPEVKNIRSTRLTASRLMHWTFKERK